METLDERASTANRATYDATTEAVAPADSPHIRHASLRALYERMATEVFERARAHTAEPTVLELGAGAGAGTRTFLDLGARVTAVDISRRQLDALAARNADVAERLTLERGDAAGILERLRREGARFDVVAAVSFLHHVPDYLAVVRAAVEVLGPDGQLFVFQDPMHVPSITPRDRRLSRVAYVSWRLAQPDVTGGFRRYLRRRRGVWLDDCPADNVEYHELRAGIDQSAIRTLLDEREFEVEVVCYFSTQSLLWQRVGERLRVRNKFALVASRDPEAQPRVGV